ncbi:arabinan endo-1,5-alpha-L-arabinosidase [Cesiribacter sp. SM1]|uniref:arabinan endo-1,5-alpha-L-arabinosidase n=1 Tax=Cesiribacter sp. SM1 TaxID=2861196 RepID=UPI001CD739A6|nr:arabinan endo-1,5-alpha-L-arabinosidase [Cesiribacter sp. SM1]
MKTTIVNKVLGLLRLFYLMVFVVAFGLVTVSCADDEPVVDDKDDTEDPVDPEEPEEPEDIVAGPFDFSRFPDDYRAIASYADRSQWGFYNVHDPAIIKDGDYYYCYSTDASYGNVIGPGIQMRRSKDLVNWQFLGLAFNGLPVKGASFISSKGGTAFNSLWAPYVIKVGSEYRLYYSLSSPTPRLSVIGLATSSNPWGPWVEKDLVVTSLADNSRQTNAIDPSVIIDQAGNHWFYYGSAWDGIYALQLDPATGFALRAGDKGTRVAQRGFTNGQPNGNIEGPEIIYNPEQQKYYLFIAYDWLETKYNVRVGRSDSPTGPFYDFHGHDMNEERDDLPMILAPYQFNGHPGYQGVSHPGVFQDGQGQYYIATQARPTNGVYFMTMHIRQMYWTADGWPVVSPERYGGLEQTAVAAEELAGEWERIVLGYRVVPGYAEEQRSPDLQRSVPLTLGADGSINGSADSQWTYSDGTLTLHWADDTVETVLVKRGRDWENQVMETLIFTGLNQEGTAVWGKKVQ